MNKSLSKCIFYSLLIKIILLVFFISWYFKKNRFWLKVSMVLWLLFFFCVEKLNDYSLFRKSTNGLSGRSIRWESWQVSRILRFSNGHVGWEISWEWIFSTTNEKLSKIWNLINFLYERGEIGDKTQRGIYLYEKE